jgi:hypothetical protein
VYHAENDVTEFFLDGNHSGGEYDAYDLHFLVNVFDFSGRSILSHPTDLPVKNDLILLNLDNAGPGLYFIRICSGEGQCYLKKLVVQ